MAEGAKRNDIEWPQAPGFKASWRQFKTDTISKAMTEFDRCKRSLPPRPLPAKVKDHKLDGPLKGFMECHLADDVLLIYKSIDGGAVKLLRICTHADLKGPKAKTLAKILKSE